MDTALLDPEMMDFVDSVETAMVSSGPLVDCPSTHRFTPGYKDFPGMYCRETLLPAGTLLTSRIHLSEHFYIILEGVGMVWSNGHAEPYHACGQIGITKPGTRRIIYAQTDTRWATFHVHTSTDPDEIVADVTYDHDHLKLNEKTPELP